ncbi:MAG: ATP-binding protein [Pseudomonadota bacterium]
MSIRTKSMMRLLMDNIPIGVIELNELMTINPAYSSFAEKALGKKNLGGKNFFEVLGISDDIRAKKQNSLSMFLDTLLRELLPEKDLAALNPFEELEVDHGDVQWIRLKYFLIKRGENRPNHLLCLIEDITEEKKLAAQIVRSQRENMQLKTIAENPDLFLEFLSETKKILNAVENSANCLKLDSQIKPIVNEMFRGVHTIKGVAASFGLSAIAESSSKMEDFLSPLREQAVVTKENMAMIQESFNTLSKAFIEVVKDAGKLLGEDIFGDTGMSIRISVKALQNQIKRIKSIPLDYGQDNETLIKIKDDIAQQLQRLTLVTARRGLARSLKLIPDLIKRLGKEVIFNFEGEETLIDIEVAAELNTPLIHIIRNALDHGIESPEQRIESGKNEAGTISLNVIQDNGKLRLRIADDGAGLDPIKLKNIALSKGFISQEEYNRLTPQECCELIFKPGFSTADQITEVSGRGVGMDAVLASIKEQLKGDIIISSEVGKGTEFIITVASTPFV